jgi:Heterokaryon incompatibility protein (HET)
VARSLLLPRDFEPLPEDCKIWLGNDVSWKLGVEMSPFDYLKSEAYSNKFDLKSKAKQSDSTAYRLVVFSREDPGVRGSIQRLGGVKQYGASEQFLGRKTSPEKIDMELLRSWMKRCHRYHPICERDGIAGRRLPENLRLINVETMEIVKAPNLHCVEYVTLSYVWGTAEMKEETGMTPSELRRSHIQRLDNGYEFTPLPKRLPLTIEDAITVTRELGYRYLWIDALCIVQDDPDVDKKVHLSCMDAVYNCSAFTIAAAAGIHADHGLPGISIPRRNSQSTELIQPGVELSAMSPSFTALENSRNLKWNRRGWTFQEKVLSKRLLLFTDFQVYFRCSESVWTEEIIMETEELSKSLKARPGKYRWAADRPQHENNPLIIPVPFIRMFVPQLLIDDEWNYLGKFPDYAAAIKEYTQRELSHPSDNLVAIEGVLSTLQAELGRFFFGLPSGFFSQSLLWYPTPGSRQARINKDNPSWSWAGWQFDSGVSYDVLDVRLLRTITITLRWIVHMTGRVVQHIPSSSSSGSDSNSGTPYNFSDTSTTSDSASGLAEASSSLASSAGSMLPEREWSTCQIVGRAVGNIATCFAWPMVFRQHTVRDMFLCSQGKVSQLRCDETFAISTFWEDEITNLKRKTRPKGRKESEVSSKEYKELARKYKAPLLVMTTPVLRFYVGTCLHNFQPVNDDESSVYELIDEAGNCVGELWTTRKMARRGRTEPLHFLTISWGVSMSMADISDDFIPRWTFDAAELPDLRTIRTMKRLLAEWFTNEPSETKAAGHHSADSHAKFEQSTVMMFLDALLHAKKDEIRPKFLWSTVNMLLVDWDGSVAERVGLGRVIFKAWMENWTPPQQVLVG